MKIKVIIKRPSEPIGHMLHIENDDEKVLQRIVGGYFEMIRIGNWAIIFNEEGKIRELPYNCRLSGIDLVGTIIIAGVKGEDLTDVPMSFEEYKEMFRREN